MDQQRNDKIHQVLLMLQAFGTAINGILAGDDFNLIRPRLQQHLTRAGNQLQALTGNTGNIQFNGANTTGVQQIIDTFEPLPATQQAFGPNAAQALKPVTIQDLDIPEAERIAFLDKRNELAARWLEMTNEQIFAQIKEPDGENLVRSVAKISGMLNFRDVELNATFIEQVRTNLQFQKQLAGADSIVGRTAQQPESYLGGGQDDDLDDDGGSEGGPNYSDYAQRMADRQNLQSTQTSSTEQPQGTDNAGAAIDNGAGPDKSDKDADTTGKTADKDQDAGADQDGGTGDKGKAGSSTRTKKA